MKKKELQPGDKLLYSGKGFIGFDKVDYVMYFIKEEGNFSYRVTYKGREMVVFRYEVEQAKKPAKN